MAITLAPPDLDRRTAVIRGLANLAAFLETHPELPLAGEWSGEPFTVYVFAGTDEENRAEIDRIARILGTAPELLHRSGAHYAAVRNFGGGVTYRALAIDSRYRADRAHLATASGAAA